MADSVRILVVDDNPDFASWLTTVLSHVSRFQVVGIAHEPDMAQRVAEMVKPDVAIVDVVMPNGGGIRATKLIKAASRTTAVLIMTGAGDPNAVIEMLRLGALGCVEKSGPLDDIIAAVGATARGVTVLSADTAASLRRELLKNAEIDPAARIDESAAVERLLEDKPFHVVFQPLVEFKTGKLCGYEALTRFPDGPPDEWFERAWRVGRGPELELAAIAIAFARLREIPSGLFLSVNVSPATLAHRGLGELLDGCEPQRILLEITEHSEIDDVEEFHAALDAVRARGVQIAVDDAGAGFANFVRLLEVIPHVIKLDRALVAGIDRDPVRVAIARSLISLASSIGAKVAAEGVETEAEARMLGKLGVRCGQGFLFGRPGPLPGVQRARRPSLD